MTQYLKFVQKHKKTIVVLSLFFILIGTLFSFAAFAQNIIKSPKWQIENPEIKLKNIKKNNKEILKERRIDIPELRTMFSRTFENKDGTLSKEIFLVPINYQDKNENWQPINTTIVFSTDPQYDYMNITNVFKTYFTVDPFGNRKNVKYQIQDSWVTFHTINSIHAKEKDQSKVLEFQDLKNDFRAKRSKSFLGLKYYFPTKKELGRPKEDQPNTFHYPDVVDQKGKTVDTDYSISSNQLLEEIILNEYQDISEISQEIILHNVFLKKDSKKINFYRKGDKNPLWFIPKPVMYEKDDPNIRNYGVEYQLTCKDNKIFSSCQRFNLKKILTPEGKKWLLNPQRNYPIVVDATDVLYPNNASYLAWKNTNSGAGYIDWATAASASSTSFTTTDYDNVASSNDVRTSATISPSSTSTASMHYSFDLSGVISTATSTLPQEVKDISACYDSTTNKFYIFGGFYLDASNNPQYLSSIVQYDPVTDVATTTSIGVLPVQLRGTSCASKDSTSIYIFGGWDNTNSVFNTNIYKFDPSSPSSNAVDTTDDLPQGREDAPAVYDTTSGKFYIFGGQWMDATNNVQYSSNIIQYDSVAHTATTTNIGILPVQLAKASVAFNASNGLVYIFGGWDNTNSVFNTNIYKFDPSSPSSNAVDTTDDLPQGREDAPAVYDTNKDKFYVFGGYYNDASTNPVYLTDILEYQVGSNAVHKDDLTFSARGIGAAFNSSNNKIYLFGGYNGSNSSFSDKVLVYNASAGYNLSEVLQIKYTHEGYYSGNAGKIYYYTDSGWTYDQDLASGTDSTLFKTFTSNISTYLDLNDKFHFSVIGEVIGGGTGGAYSDMAKLEVTYGSPPAFTVAPDDSSDGTNPTNVGSNVTFTATASDPNGDQWQLVVCKTAGLLNADCDGGASDRWCASSLVNSGIQANCTYTAQSGDNESNTWYAYACDDNTTCSSYSNSASPFKINHLPDLTAISDNGPIDSSQTITFSSTASDSDVDTATDTIVLLICKTAGISGTACDGGTSDTWCSTSLVTSNPSCSSTSTLSVGTKSYYSYIFDNHNLGALNNSTSSSFTINNATPTISSVLINSGNNITLTEGATTTISVTATVSDNNGCGDIATTTMKFYRSGVGSSCLADNNNCYNSITCSQDGGSCSGDTDTTATYTCNVNVWYFADATDSGTYEAQNWIGLITTQDTNNLTDSASSTTEMYSLSAFSITDTITYGTVPPGGTSSQASTTITNTGNTRIDMSITGSSMNCDTGSMPATNQHYSFTSGFSWADGEILSTTEPGVCSYFVPELRGSGAILKDANEAYILGGYDKTNSVFNTNIYSFDPSDTSKLARDTGNDIPQGLEYAPAVYYNGKIYLFGGYWLDASSTVHYSNQVVEYNISTGVATSTGVGDLPIELAGASVALNTSDNKIYIFGGWDNTSSVYNATIYKFDPVNPSINATTTGHVLPQGLKDTAVAYDTTTNDFYLFGGYYESAGTPYYSNNIVQYTGLANATNVATLPFQLRGASASAKDANEIYIFGGYNNTSSIYNKTILSYDPSNPSINATTTSNNFPFGFKDAPSIYDSTSGGYYLFGGYYGTSTSTYMNEISQWTPDVLIDYNINVAKPTSTSPTSLNMYWLLQPPSIALGGTCSGVNTFTAVYDLKSD